MGTRLARPAAVPLDFLSWIERDESWLTNELAKQGLDADVQMGKGTLEVNSEAALRAVNRIRSFAHIAADSLRPPFIDLMVADGSDTFRCVTIFAKSLVPDIGPLDFTKEVFTVTSADPALIDLCRVDPKISADYQGLDRDTFRDRYFDNAGHLRIEFVHLNNDANFVAEAIDHGFFVRQGDLTGRLRLESE